MRTLFRLAALALVLLAPSMVAAGARPLYGDFETKVDMEQTLYTPDSAPKTPALEDLQLTDTITQYGITWKLDQKVRVGRFVTGDWYFVGPATVVEITPKPLFGEEVEKAGWKIFNEASVKEIDKYKGKFARNGSTLNQPVTTLRAGFDSRLADGFYDPALFHRPPLAMKPGDSLISTISNPELKDLRGYGVPVLGAAVLTCMSAPQPPDAFRPSYCDTANKVYLARNLHRELLYSLPAPADTPKIEEWVRRFMRPWIDTVSWGYAGPQNNMPRYGQWYTDAVSTVSLMLQLDFPAKQKEKLLIHYVQYGIDLWGTVRAGYEGWPGHGGFGGGRKWTIIFAGLMLGDPDMQNVAKSYPKCRFAEDEQTKFGKSWSGFDVIFESHPGWRPYFSETQTPDKWVEKPNNNGQSEGYRRCCTSIVWPGQALAARMMRAEKLWDHDAFFAYVDRWMTEDLHKTAKELLDAMDAAKGKDPKQRKTYWYEKMDYTDKFSQGMWDAYRKNLPPARTPAL